jgi:hypothetical protein
MKGRSQRAMATSHWTKQGELAVPTASSTMAVLRLILYAKAAFQTACVGKFSALELKT